MDVTGRAPGFRGVAIRCPGCAEPMSREALAAPASAGGTDAELDVCGACAGVWIDWFDGDPSAVAAEVVTRGIVGRPSAPDGLRNEPSALGACPRCSYQLVAERRPVGQARVELLRCEHCAGVFATRAALEQLAAAAAEAR